MNYAAWLREQTGQPFRLLTEAEWEYCCRASTMTIFGTGDDIDPSQANYLYDEHGFKVGPGHRTPKGTYAPNAFGLEDMHGNVCEWVADVWRPTHDAILCDGLRVIRGGAWDYMPRLLRSAWRDFASPETRRDNLGFRIACDL
jgi:formylglycine-generating enzyme required for sulfatase activity